MVRAYYDNHTCIFHILLKRCQFDLTGICMRRKDAYDRDSLHFAPFLLLPSPFPRDEFDKVCKIQPLLNELMHKVAHDNEFLKETLKQTIEVDEFTKRLYDIHQTIQNEGGPAQVRLINHEKEYPLRYTYLHS